MLRVASATTAMGFALGCASDGPQRQAGTPPDVTPPSVLCEDPSLEPGDFCLPVDSLAGVLERRDIEILHVGIASGGTSRPNTAYLRVPGAETSETLVIKGKWAKAPTGGDGFNNSPRREIAAYQIQSLFLEADQFVVPLTVGRCVPLERHVREVGRAQETFPGTGCVYGAFAYWLQDVTSEDARDFERAERDPAYREALARLNLFTYVIGHRDSRDGNFLVSKDPARPRVLSIDNDIAFKGFKNPFTYGPFVRDWSKIQVDALPRGDVERLRQVTRADLDRLLVVEQYEMVDGLLVSVPPGPPLSDRGGVEFDGRIVQIGLDRAEVDGIDRRIRKLLERVDAGEIDTF
jgi:hypothetical protein